MSPEVHLRHLNCHHFSTSLTTFKLNSNMSVTLIHLNNIEETSQSVERYILPIMNMDSAVTNPFYTFCTTKSGVDDT